MVKSVVFDGKSLVISAVNFCKSFLKYKYVVV